jgi:hypothetical protein
MKHLLVKLVLRKERNRQQDRQIRQVDVFGEMNYQHMTTSDAFSNCLSHLMTFYDQVTTLVMNGEGLWLYTALSILGEDLLTALTITGDNLLTTLTTTGKDLLTTCDDDTDDHYDNADL